MNSVEDVLTNHDEAVIRAQIRTSLIDWAANVMKTAGLTPSTHHRVLLTSLELLTSGHIRRLMVLMPPGSAKSTYASVIFPIWWFIQHPRSSIIAASHTAMLVKYFSHSVQATIREHRGRVGFDIHPHEQSVAHWRTTAGGEYFGVGVRGAITGRRADLVIIDDPIKSMAEATSVKHRQYLWDWYTADLMTRLKPDARVVIVMTRWHEDDLCGQLIAQNSEDWQVIRFPAIAEADDALGRPPGAPLWPEWESLEALNKKKAVVGAHIWSALFQQSPQSATGSLFDVRRLRPEELDRPASSLRKVVRAWDLAATAQTGQNDPDWTVGLRLAREESGRYIVEDIVRFRGNHRTVQDQIVSVARLDGHSVVVSLPLDPGQAGKSQIGELSALLSGFRVYTSRERGSKWSRATVASTQFDADNVSIRPGSWNRAFLEELSLFPRGENDDQIDALARAFITISDLPTSTKRIYLPFNSR